MKKIATLGALALTIIAAGCGTTASGDASAVREAADAVDETAQNVAEAEMPEVSEEEVTLFFDAKRDRRAAHVEPDKGPATIESEVVSCTLEEPGPSYGKARCIEEVTFSYPVSGVSTKTYVWLAAYDTESGEIVSYRQVG